MPNPPLSRKRWSVVWAFARRPSGQWYLEYSDREADDEVAFNWGDERFIEEKCISIKTGETMHTYRITLVERP
jgi:hypothetical protein